MPIDRPRPPWNARTALIALVAAGLGLGVGAAAGQTPRASREGDTGPHVEAVQRALNARLVPSPDLSVDGDFGTGTRAAVERFQRSRGLAPTGQADEATWQALGPAPEAPPVPSPASVNAGPFPKRPADPIDGPPFVSSKAWAIVDGSTGALVAGQDEARPLEIASTTKIMTAYLVVKLAAATPALMDEAVTFSKRADETPGSTSGVREGERLPVGELLYGLLLPSGNDAAVALAEHLGDRFPGEPGTDPLARFVAAMNREADTLGLRETRFANPHGLPAPDHRASARDLARLASRAMAEPGFALRVGTPRRGSTLVDRSGGRRDVVWSNTNKLLEVDGYDGVKTGTTNAAGSCLVASGRRGGDHLIVVALGAGSSAARDADVRNLFRWAWSRRR